MATGDVPRSWHSLELPSPVVDELRTNVYRMLVDQNVIREDEITSDDVVECYQSFVYALERCLGANSQVPRRLIKLPNDACLDFEENGAVFQFLRLCFNHSDKVASFLASGNTETVTDFLANAFEHLISTKCIVAPRVFLSSEFSASESKKLAAILEAHQCALVDSAAAASHLVDSVDRQTLKVPTIDAPKLYAFRQHGNTMIFHWKGRPDSYNVWLASREAPEEPKLTNWDQCPQSVNWVFDMDYYNEWMNPSDYISRYPNRFRIRLRKASAGYKIIASTYGRPAHNIVPSKRADIVPLDTEGLDSIALASPKPITRESIQPSISAIPSIEDDLPYAGPLLSSTILAAPRYPVVMPSYSSWFDMDCIHANERRSLSEIIPDGNSAAASQYMAIRNFMVRAYRANPRVHLTGTACRKMLACDAQRVLRVHGFLASWGLINYHVDVGSLPCMPGIGHVNEVKEEESYLFWQTPYAGVVPAPRRPKNALEPTRESVRHAISRGPLSRAPPAESCVACDSNCSVVKYRATNNDMNDDDYNVVICERCFKLGRFPMNLQAGAFNREVTYGKTAEPGEEPWTDDEVSKLIEAVRKFEDNDWKGVSAAVGSRTSSECIRQFIELPLEGQVRTGEVPEREGLKFQVTSNLEQAPSPIEDVAHPILAQLAFMASMCDPQELARKSVAAIQQNDKAIRASSATPSPHTGTTSRADAPTSESAPMDTSADVSEVEYGVRVITPVFGEGIVCGPVRADCIVPVKLPYAMLYTLVSEVIPVDESSSLIQVDTPFGPGHATEVTDATIANDYVDRYIDVRFPRATASLPATVIHSTGAREEHKSSIRAAGPPTTAAEVLQDSIERCLLTTAFNAKQLSVEEMRHMLKLIARIAEKIIERIEIKTKGFDKLHQLMLRELERLNQLRQETFADRIEYASTRFRASRPATSTTGLRTIRDATPLVPSNGSPRVNHSSG